MKKRMISIFIAISVFFGMLCFAGTPFSAAGELTSADGKYKYTTSVYDSNTVATITTYLGSEKDVVVPAEIDGYMVIALAEYAFFMKEMETVVVSLGISTIGQTAFSRCPNLTRLELPITVSVVPERMCYKSTMLKSVVLPSITRINENAFSGCTSLEEVTIPKGLTYLDNSAFDLCTGLNNIYVAEGNTLFSSIDGVMFSADKKTLKKYPSGRAGAYAVPEGTVSIGTYAFAQTIKLTDVTIPSSVMFIGAYAFFCSELKNFYAPKGLISIGENAFELAAYMEICTLPDSASSIGTNAFANCGVLTFHCNTGSKTMTYAIQNNINYATLSGIMVSKMPSKTTYIVGESFDETGLEVAEHYTDNLPGLQILDYELSGFDSTTVGEKTVTVTRGTDSTAFTVNVVNPTASSIEITALPTKTSYLSTEAFDSTGLEIVYIIGAETETVEEYELSEIDRTVSGEQTITVTVDDIFTDTFTITVTAAKGDLIMNGNIGIDDVLMHFKYVAGVSTLTEEQFAAADINDDGTVDITECLRLFKFVAGLTSEI